MPECNTCLEEQRTVDCSNDKCEWNMCYSCAGKWYEHKTLCPACRTPQKKHYRRTIAYVENIIFLKILACYTAVLAVMLIIGRFCALLFNIGPTDLWCGGDVDLCFQTMLTGATVLMIGSLASISLFMFIVNIVRLL